MWQDLLKVTQILPKPNSKSSSLAKKDINWDFLPEFRPFRIPRLLLERVIYSSSCNVISTFSNTRKPTYEVIFRLLLEQKEKKRCKVKMKV